jgi:aspartate 1-decarboxylase
VQRQMLKSKIHRATVTDCDLHYAGSITLDPDLMREADLLANELVHVLDIDNGSRFETYVIEGRPGSREVQVNGAAARLVQRGDRVIIVSYGAYSEEELERHQPRVVHVDAGNEIVRVDADPAAVV